MKQIPPAEALSSWEAARGPWETIVGTARVCGVVLLQPILFFQAVSKDQTVPRKRLIHAFLFALILGYVKLLCDGLNVLWLKQLATAGLPMGNLSAQIVVLETSFFSDPVVLARPLVTLAATLLLVAAGVKLILGVGENLAPAVLVVCYKSAADVFNVVPFLGGLLASAWSLALLVIGIRELYRVGVGRAILAGAVMPVFVLFFFVLSLGPAANRVIVALYPETQPQVMKFNDVTAYGYTSAIVRAAADYKNDLGFYPPHLDALKKYLTPPLADDLRSSDEASGYRFTYTKSGEDHFVVTARPLESGVTGNLVFYADDSGEVRLDAEDGPVLTDMQSVEKAAAAPARE